jgi:hypothetical protein
LIPFDTWRNKLAACRLFFVSLQAPTPLLEWIAINSLRGFLFDSERTRRNLVGCGGNHGLLISLRDADNPLAFIKG